MTDSASLFSIITGFILAAQIVLLVYTIIRRNRDRKHQIWLIGTMLPMLAVTGLQLLDADFNITPNFSRDALLWLALSTSFVIYCGMIIIDMTRAQLRSRAQTAWLGISAMWLIALIATSFLSQPGLVGWADWSPEIAPTIAALCGVFGLAALSTLILGLSFYAFYTAAMPEVANRSAYWAVTTTILLVSMTLIASSSPVLMVVGTLILYVALSVTTYGMYNYRLVDIRGSILVAARTLIFTGIVWSLIFGALYWSAAILPNQLPVETPNPEAVLLLWLASFALIVAVVIIPVRQIVDTLFDQINFGKRTSLASATAQYSQRVARAASLEEVVEATTSTLSRILGVKQSALILINNTIRVPDAVEFVVLGRDATLKEPSQSGFISKNGSIFHTLSIAQVPLGQFDIEYGPVYENATEEEKAFFKSLGMSVYVPIIADDRLIGVLASGPKSNDMPYQRPDVELLTVIGQQVGTALRSARLIDDLQHLNDTMRVLNKRLEGAKHELEKLDSIKTDFITIASHELRTPLAQIRGYTDIIDSLNEAGILQKEQASQMVANLRKSTERMEELISAMLDVSQIDVNSMDLRFVRTTPETVVRMALDPLKDPAAQRNLTIEREGLSGLPHMQADMQRLVQAFRNIILNAIKFTPDGGSIHISATIEEAEVEDNFDLVLFKITDTGVGIDKKDQEFIFQKFYRAFDTQLHSTGLYKFLGAGPGLGLTIAKGIIEGHGGQIWVESPGHSIEDPPGSTFFVRLPMTPPEGTRRLKALSGESTTGMGNGQQPITDTGFEVNEDEEDGTDTREPSGEVNIINTRIPRKPDILT